MLGYVGLDTWRSRMIDNSRRKINENNEASSNIKEFELTSERIEYLSNRSNRNQFKKKKSCEFLKIIRNRIPRIKREKRT